MCRLQKKRKLLKSIVDFRYSIPNLNTAIIRLKVIKKTYEFHTVCRLVHCRVEFLTLVKQSLIDLFAFFSKKKPESL